IMETQPGSVNWAEVNRTLNRGEARCMAWHAIAHGADAILYWQWRPAPGGQEQLHGSLLGADGAPRPFYSEAKQLGQELRKVNGVLEAAENKNQVAILHTYESRWSINWQKHNRNFDPVELLLHFYRPLIDRNIGVDILGSDADFGGYKLLIASGTVILTDAMCRSLQSYVEQGGLLVLTVRCGQKDAYNALFPTLQPGPLREIAGAEVAEYYALDQPAPVDARWQNRRAGEGTLWAEMLRPLHSGTQTLASYGECNGWLDGAPAVTMKQAGPNGGAVVMVGTVLDSALQDSLTTWLLAAARVQPELPDSPPGVEIARRVRSDGTAVHFYINHTAELKEAPLHDRAEDLLSGEHVQGSVILEPYAVKLFQSAH
ncbi:MAG TPA: beta-galactosidase trimerization domain-containing protein, partial [Chthonomonadales bacterium]|nr:beta-galactosidase trimerization domain-containing protein [Chthonomonadales bacterium]